MEASTPATANGQSVAPVAESPTCIGIFQRGVKNSEDFAQGFIALMADLATGRLNASVGNAICNAGGKVLKVKEMELKYGTRGPGTGRRVLQLSDGEPLERESEKQ